MTRKSNGEPPGGSLLLHICCAPCAVGSIPALREEGFVLTGYWHNPNIHPFTEYRARRNALREYAASIGLPLLEEDAYGLRPFLREVGEDVESPARCMVCYRLRMEAAARFAAANGFPAFTTTLTISPYQDHDLIRAAGEAAGEKFGVQFLYRDFRPRFREGQNQAREAGIYMQKYCGCLFSEEERHQKRKKSKPSEKSGIAAESKT